MTGLTTALALAEAGHHVTVVARETHEAVVSSVAAAVWTITEAEPVASARLWALASRERFVALAEDRDTGVVPLRHRELERTEPPPSWWESYDFVRRLGPDDTPAGYAGGWSIDGFMIEPSIYLSWLTDRLADRGVEILTRDVGALADPDGDAVVNCTGLGAARLTGDDQMFPIRGQVVVVANPGVHDATADECDPDRIAYVYPRSRTVVLGGTRQAGRSDLDPEASETERILADTAVLDPRTAGSDVLDVRVGLRPGRSTVRVQAEQLHDGRRVVHNYGHAGAGYILSWGCALEVVGLLAE